MSDLRNADTAVAASTPMRLRGTRVAAGLLVTLAVCLQEPARAFSYDAGHYWGGATAVLGGGSVFEQGLLTVRGVLTSFLYLPSAAVAQVLGERAAGPAVLLQNALLIAVVGTVLLPAVVAVWRPVTPVVVWVCAAAGALLLAGLAPFPLTDLWAAALLLAAVVALDGRGWLRLALAGLAAGLAFHLRPAALIPVAALVVAVAVARRLAVLWFLGGTAVALLPQFLLNRWRGTTWLPWPEATGALTEVQASYASFVVRYDTVMSGQVSDPRLFFCSPGMARALDGDVPGSTGELAKAFLSHFPQALVLSVQKVGAALHWPLSMPYYDPAPGADGLFAVLVTGIAVLGAVAVLRAAVRRGRRTLSLAQVGVLLVLAGSVLTLTTSATETRFALPLVLVGIAGCALLGTERPDRPVPRADRLWLVGAVVAAGAVFGAGVWGLGHPVEGDVTAARCSTS